VHKYHLTSVCLGELCEPIDSSTKISIPVSSLIPLFNASSSDSHPSLVSPGICHSPLKKSCPGFFLTNKILPLYFTIPTTASLLLSR